jgi:hypothetical protein
MSNLDNTLRETIISHLEKGYNSDIVKTLIQFSTLIGIWSIKGQSLCTYDDINFVTLLTSDEIENDFIPTQSNPTPENLSDLANAVELALDNTPFDFQSISIFDRQTEKNSLHLLTDLLTEYKVKLGNSLARETFTLTIDSIYDNHKVNENTEKIYKNVIQLRYLEGYSTEVIKDILSFKINLMEWSSSGFKYLDEDSLDLIYVALRKEGKEFETAITPRTTAEAKLLTENLVTNLAEIEYQPLKMLTTITKDDNLNLLLTIINNYSAKIGSELMEQTFTSLLMEMLTETSNYNNQTNE